MKTACILILAAAFCYEASALGANPETLALQGTILGQEEVRVVSWKRGDPATGSATNFVSCTESSRTCLLVIAGMPD